MLPRIWANSPMHLGPQERNAEEGEGADDVVRLPDRGCRVDVKQRGQAESLRTGKNHPGQCDVEDHIHDEILEHRDRQHDSCEPGAKEAEIGHDPGYDRNAGDCHGQSEDQGESRAIPSRTEQLIGAAPCKGNDESNGERNRAAEQCDRDDGSPFTSRRMSSDLGAGAEHEQYEPQLINDAEADFARASITEDRLLPMR